MYRVAVLCVLVTVGVLTQGDDKYSDKYDHINVEDIIKNDRLLNHYNTCLLADSDDKCPEAGKFLRTTLAEVLSTDCARCTDKQKDNAQLCIKYMVANKPQLWNDIAGKYDPDGNFLKKHPEFAAKP